MRPHVQFLERPLRLARGLVKRIIRREAQPLHPLAELGDKPKVSAENFAQPSRLGRGQVVRIHLGGSLYRFHQSGVQQEDGFES